MNNSHQNHNQSTNSQILNYQIIQTIYDGTRTLGSRGQIEYQSNWDNRDIPFR